MIICQFSPKFASAQVSTQVHIPPMTLIAHNGKLVMLDWQTYKKQKLIDYIKKNNLDINENNLSQKNPSQLDNNSPDEAVILNTIAQINDYLVGERQAFDIAMDLSIGTLFQQKVWQQLLQIPYGKTISYAQLAQNIGQPTAYRAVANANGKNPIALLIPCHRVIASGGGLGGYTGGVQIKQALLNVEKGEIERQNVENLNGNCA